MKYLSLILSISVLLLSVVPCCLEDKCLSAYTETVETSNDDCNSCDDCSDSSCCSPFLHCNTCSGFPEARYSNLLNVTVTLISDCELEYILRNDLSDFISSIWQPPKA